jgi:hypothetical protein
LKLNEQWPALAFALAVVVAVSPAIIAAVSDATSASPSGWCQGDENGVVCARQWLGTMATFAIGFVAAAIAWRAYQVAKIPFLNQRIDYCINLQNIRTRMEEEKRSFCNLNDELAVVRAESIPTGKLVTKTGAYISSMSDAYSKIHALNMQMEKEFDKARNFGVIIYPIVAKCGVRSTVTLQLFSDYVAAFQDRISEGKVERDYILDKTRDINDEIAPVEVEKLERLLRGLENLSALEPVIAELVHERDRCAGLSA